MATKTTPDGLLADITDAESILNTLPDAVVLVNRDGDILFANLAAQDFFATGLNMLRRQKITDLVADGNPLLALLDQVWQRSYSAAEYGLQLSHPRYGQRNVDAQIMHMMETPDQLVITLRERGIARRIDNQLIHRGAARSVVSMSSVLAHEIKNPLSGIRGAAQLIELNTDEDNRALTQLICQETDRIVSLVDRMEAFSDAGPGEFAAVNIHEVLEHVRRLAENGFAKHVHFIEQYDPSIPPVFGNRDQLVQVYLNLVKNAAEAVPEEGGEIRLTTAYRHGVRIAIPGTQERLDLPIEICVIDNGPGVPEEFQSYMFDPFVTTKTGGTGLGLALVAKIIGDHGGIVDCDSVPRRTVFRTLMPAFNPEASDR